MKATENKEVKRKTTLSLLPTVTARHIMALAIVVSENAERDALGDYTMTPAQASALIPSLIIKGINAPMLAKTLASHLNDKKGKGLFGLLALANDERKAFRSLNDKSAYREAKRANGESAMAELLKEEWN